MSTIGYIREDFVTTYSKPDKKSKSSLSLAFGDKVEILEEANGWTKLRMLDNYFAAIKYVRGTLDLNSKGVLKVSMVDVQQGDGMIIESPEGKIVFVDGGDNKLFARHAAARFQYRNSSETNPLPVEAIIVTHGDADHFDGLNEIVDSETNKKKRKRLFIKPKRIFHNGLVKAPSKIKGKYVSDKNRFGATTKQGDDLYATDLMDDTRAADSTMINAPFKRWHKSIDHWDSRPGDPIEMKRVAYGMDEKKLFDFLFDEKIKIELLGPFTDKVKDGNVEKEALPFLHRHGDGTMVHLDTESHSNSVSASHTINGHSIAFRLTFGRVRMLFTGDLNKESLDRLLDKVKSRGKLRCEVFKTPHHGSHDFAFEAIKKAAPIVSLISSGDESAIKEHIHPRATLMSALGRATRNDMGIILSTELAAFYSYKRECYTRDDLADFFKKSKQKSYTSEELRLLFSGIPKKEDPKGMFQGFERTNFGIVHIRTDGERMLVFTHSGKEGLNEAYSYKIGKRYKVTPLKIQKRT